MIFILFITFLYLLLIIWLIIGFYKVENFKVTNKSSNYKFSIIIPFRNEEFNIFDLTESLQKINYPKNNFEVLFVDDDSTDNSVSILNKFISKNANWKLLKNIRKSNSPKKDAINTAIQIAKCDWIITTDADCEVPKNWLLSFSEFIKQNSKIKMIAAPVAYKTNKTFLQNFQNMDFLSLIGSTIGAFGNGKPFLCNGANLCYKKEIFIAINGFEGNDNVASGDDVFLMEKILFHYPNSVFFIKSKEAIVITKPENNFADLLSQRVRWTSKTSATKNWFGKLIGALVFLMNLVLVFSVGLLILHYFTEIHRVLLRFTEVLLFVFLLKFNLDFYLIQKTYKFIGINNGLKSYILSSIIYPFFVVFVVFISFFKKFEWKGRYFKK